MALFPLTSNFEGDFVLQLVAVDTDNTMDEVAAAAAVHSVGRRVGPAPATSCGSAARAGRVLAAHHEGGRLRPQAHRDGGDHLAGAVGVKP
jgi:hypothetical protein